MADVLACADSFPPARSGYSSSRWIKSGRSKYAWSREFAGATRGVFPKLSVGPGIARLSRANPEQAERMAAMHGQLREMSKNPSTGLLVRPLTKELAVALGEWMPDEDYVKNYVARPLTEGMAIRLGEWVPPADRHWNRVTHMSRRSENMLRRRIGELDLAPVLEAGAPALLTFTLPGPWEQLTPDAESASVIWNRFATVWADMFGERMAAIVAREFQDRGAPHWHVWTTLPERPAGWRIWDTEEVDGTVYEFFRLGTIDEWRDQLQGTIAIAWSRNLRMPDRSPQWRRHFYLSLEHGTHISYTQGGRMRDPRRLSTYFLKESTAASKAYQKGAPAIWLGLEEETDWRTGELVPVSRWGLPKLKPGAGVGRYWMIRNIANAVVHIDVHPPEAARVWRTLREVRERRHAPGAQRRRVKSSAGFVLVNDGAEFASQIGTWLTELRHDDTLVVSIGDRESWTKIRIPTARADANRAAYFAAHDAIAQRSEFERLFEEISTSAHFENRTKVRIAAPPE